MNERRNIFTYINAIFNGYYKNIKKRFTKVVVVERVVVRVERIPKVIEKTVILYTDDPQYKKEQSERIH